MQNQPLEQQNITISGIEDVGWGIKIKDENGQVFNVSKTKKGTEIKTAAFQVLETLAGYGMGMNKCFKFVIVPNNQGGQSRYVRIIEEPQANNTGAQNAPVNVPAPQNVNKPINQVNNAPASPSPAVVTPQNGEVRGMTRCKIAEAFIKAGANPDLDNNLISQMDKYVNWIMTGKRLATLEEKETQDKVKVDNFASPTETPLADEGEIKVENIPF